MSINKINKMTKIPEKRLNWQQFAVVTLQTHSKELCRAHMAVNRLMLSNCSTKTPLLTSLTGRVARSINE